jgi:hypothetical protein
MYLSTPFPGFEFKGMTAKGPPPPARKSKKRIFKINQQITSNSRNEE